MGWADYHIKELQAGRSVQFRPRGNSMTPHIKSGDLVSVSPLKVGIMTEGYDATVGIGKQLSVGDIVLCKVNGSQYLHFISAIREKGINNFQFQISNARGFVNGWIGVDKIYGKVTEVVHEPVR